MRPSSKWISLGCHVWLWSKPSGSGFDGFLERLNQSRSGSSSGIHSLTARQGGSMRSRLSISKGGGGGRGKCTTPSQSPCRRRKNSTSSQRSTGLKRHLVGTLHQSRSSPEIRIIALRRAHDFLDRMLGDEIADRRHSKGRMNFMAPNGSIIVFYARYG